MENTEPPNGGTDPPEPNPDPESPTEQSVGDTLPSTSSQEVLLSDGETPSQSVSVLPSGITMTSSSKGNTDEVCPPKKSRFLGGTPDVGGGLLIVRRKSIEGISDADFKYILGALAAAMLKEKADTGTMPAVPCGGGKLAGNAVVYQLMNGPAVDFMRNCINALPGWGENHGGYRCALAGEAVPQRYGAWVPDDLALVKEAIPEFLAQNSGDALNPTTVTVVGATKAPKGGHIVVFDISGEGLEYIQNHPGGVVCITHRMRFFKGGAGRPRQTPKNAPGDNKGKNKKKVARPPTSCGDEAEKGRRKFQKR